jgi:hypothetical protein
MRSPRGLQRGWPSLSPHWVSARASPPSVDSSHSVLVALLSSIEWRVTAATACAPSGARLGAPMRSIFHRSSTVSGFFLGMVGEGTGPEGQGRANAQRMGGHHARGRASWKSRWLRTVGHSGAVML